MHAIDAATSSDQEASFRAPGTFASWWTVFIFFLLYALSYIDRQILNFLVDPIRTTLGISDFQFSLAQGLAFALLFTLLGMPIGWLVDHRPRRPIIFGGVAIWSIAASACGFASHYWQFLLARVGLAGGEATLAPASFSMLSDTFPPRKLALPMSVMTVGSSVGTVVAAAVAGWAVATVPATGIDIPLLGHFHNWQVAMIAIGLPGMLLAPIIFTVTEPVRHRQAPAGGKPAKNEALRFMRGHKRFYTGHLVGLGFYSMANYAALSWLPTFFIRHHGWSVGDAALTLGSLHLFAGVPGTILMGFIVDRWYSAGRRNAHLCFLAIAAVIQMTLIVAAVLSPSPYVAIACLAPFSALANFAGVGAAALQIATPRQMRGQVSAIYLLVYNLMGLGLGPSIVAILTDFLFRDESAVGYSLLISCAGCALLACALLLFAASARSGNGGEKG